MGTEKATTAVLASTSTCQDSDCGDSDCVEHGTEDRTVDASSVSDPNQSSFRSHSTSTDNLGIINFVYKSDRPFDTPKLMSLIHTWPIPVKENLSDLFRYEKENEGSDAPSPTGNDTRESPFSGVLRSKGFCWLTPTKWNNDDFNPDEGDAWRHDTVMYWSHVGRHFGISVAGTWWDTLSKEGIREFFKDDPNEYERIMKEEFQPGSMYGDRRQELVFIGVNIDKQQITDALDACLLDDVGM